MSGTALAARRILTGPASQYILYWTASIGLPARSPLIRPPAQRFKITEGLATGRLLPATPCFQTV